MGREPIPTDESCSNRSRAGAQPAPARSRLDDRDELVVPLCVEDVFIAKKRVVTGRTRIFSVTKEREEQVEVPVIREQVKIERRKVGEPVESTPAIRREGETLIIPVMEEQWFLERRLVLKEEVRVTRVRKTEIHRERVVTRRQKLKVERFRKQRQEP